MVVSDKQPNIVVIGGGTGSFTLLSGLKRQTKNITALVNMADDGGSSGVLRDELGVLPPGDIRQCLVALSESPQALRDLFNYRFPNDTSLAGHSFGNLFLSAVEMMHDNFAEGVAMASEILKITGRVLPITLTKSTLHLATADGEVTGQHNIANTPILLKEKPRLWLLPHARLNPEAGQAIANASLVVIAPGDLYGSLVPALLVDEVAEALSATPAKVVYVCNLINKPVQTKDFTVNEYASELERFIGKGTLDYVFYNTDSPDKALLKSYSREGEFPVIVDERELRKASYTAVGGAFLSRQPAQRDPVDNGVYHSLIRHDAEAVCKELMRLTVEKA
ncbi:MAG TPA: gluconeogenesis factor YvcK family protein [Candidatus Saccharimonadales bacterium]|nr:gluconeogenesis factor YvcK family protein [Candidatus Saccharimonadales bacterium]